MSYNDWSILIFNYKNALIYSFSPTCSIKINYMVKCCRVSIKKVLISNWVISINTFTSVYCNPSETCIWKDSEKFIFLININFPIIYKNNRKTFWASYWVTMRTKQTNDWFCRRTGDSPVNLCIQSVSLDNWAEIYTRFANALREFYDQTHFKNISKCVWLQRSLEILASLV